MARNAKTLHRKQRSFILLVLSVLTLAGLVLNFSHRTDTFRVCPDTDYCNSTAYRNNLEGVKTITYKGFPFRVKAGNPDYGCFTATESSICEGSTYHPASKEYELANLAIVLLPIALYAVALKFLKYPAQKKRKVALFAGVALVSTWGGLIITNHMYDTTVREGLFGDVVSGLPFADELHLSSSCGQAYSGLQFEECAAGQINSGSTIRKPVRFYLNWVIWSVLFCGLTRLAFWIVSMVRKPKAKIAS